MCDKQKWSWWESEESLWKLENDDTILHCIALIISKSRTKFGWHRVFSQRWESRSQRSHVWFWWEFLCIYFRYDLRSNIYVNNSEHCKYRKWFQSCLRFCFLAIRMAVTPTIGKWCRWFTEGLEITRNLRVCCCRHGFLGRWNNFEFQGRNLIE